MSAPPAATLVMQWVREHGVGPVLPSFVQVDAAVAQLVRDLPRDRTATQRLDNRAVFELPRILERIVAQADMPVPARLMFLQASRDSC